MLFDFGAITLGDCASLVSGQLIATYFQYMLLHLLTLPLQVKLYINGHCVDNLLTRKLITNDQSVHYEPILYNILRNDL